MNNRSNWKRRITKLPRKLAKPTCFANTLFYLFWTLLIVGKGFGMTANNRPMRILTWIGISLAILKMAVEKWKKNELIISMALIVAGILVYVFSQDAAVLLTVIVICGTKGIDLHFLFKYSFWIRLILFLSVSTLAIFNVIDRELLIRYDSGNVHTIRYALGYGHPNATHYTLFSICVLLFLSYSYNKIWLYCILELYNYFIFSYTDSRTGFIMTSFLIVFMYVARKKYFESAMLKASPLLCNTYIVLATVSIMIPILIQYLFGFKKYGTMYSRFTTGLRVMQNYNLRLFGQPGINTDFGYVFIAYAYGVVVLALFIIINTSLMRFFIAEHRYTEFVILLSYSIYTLMESYSASVLMNISLLMSSILVYESTRRMYMRKDIYDSKEFVTSRE